MSSSTLKEAPAGVPPLLSTVSGLALAAATGGLMGLLTRHVFDLATQYNAPASLGSAAFWAPAIIAGTTLFAITAGNNISTGGRGVVTFLGQRLKSPLLSEGSHPLPPGFDAIDVDCTEQPRRQHSVAIDDDDDDAISSDGIEMEGSFLWAYQVYDPYLYLSKTHPEETLDGVGAGAMRSGFAKKTMTELLTPEEKSELSDSILDTLEKRGHRYGIQVTLAVVTEVLPPKAIRDENAKRAIELIQRDYEKIELDGVIARIRELTADDVGFTPDKAYDVLATERKKQTVTKVVNEFNIPESVMFIIEKIVEQVFKEKK